MEESIALRPLKNLIQWPTQKIDQTWVEAGLDVSEEYVYRTYAIDKPAKGEKLLKPKNPPQKPIDEKPIADLKGKNGKNAKQYPDTSNFNRNLNADKPSLKSLLNDLRSFFAPAR